MTQREKEHAEYEEKAYERGEYVIAQVSEEVLAEIFECMDRDPDVIEGKLWSLKEFIVRYYKNYESKVSEYGMNKLSKKSS